MGQSRANCANHGDSFSNFGYLLLDEEAYQ
jgi:hypothetical protein